jgi:hypothetical protein
MVSIVIYVERPSQELRIGEQKTAQMKESWLFEESKPRASRYARLPARPSTQKETAF